MTLIMLLTHFTASPLPFTPHLCEQYPKDLRFSPVITDTQPAHLSKYLLSNQAPLQSLPEICVDSSHSKQKMSNQDLCGAGKVFHKEFACRETHGHVTDGDKTTGGRIWGAGGERGAREGCCGRAERGGGGGRVQRSQGSSFGVCMCVPLRACVYMCMHVCASMCMLVQMCASRRSTPGEHGNVGREDNGILETELTFDSCSTGENLMRTKICLPNSPKKSLKHFVIPKCLENELVALQEPFCAPSAICSSLSSPCRGMLHAAVPSAASTRLRARQSPWRGAAGRRVPASHPALAPTLPTQASGLPHASVSPSRDFKRRPGQGVHPGTVVKRGKPSPSCGRCQEPCCEPALGHFS